MRQLVKSVFSFTVVHYEDDPIEDIHHAVREAYDGTAVGIDKHLGTERVTGEEARGILIEMGNDGEFFAELEDEEGDTT